MKPKIKKWIMFFGLVFMLNYYVIFTWLLFEMFAIPDKMIILNMNAYGEATFEFIMNIVSIPVVFITLILIMILVRDM